MMQLIKATPAAATTFRKNLKILVVCMFQSSISTRDVSICPTSSRVAVRPVVRTALSKVKRLRGRLHPLICAC
jgi:hypothetical protein